MTLALRTRLRCPPNLQSSNVGGVCQCANAGARCRRPASHPKLDAASHPKLDAASHPKLDAAPNLQTHPAAGPTSSTGATARHSTPPRSKRRPLSWRRRMQQMGAPRGSRRKAGCYVAVLARGTGRAPRADARRSRRWGSVAAAAAAAGEVVDGALGGRWASRGVREQGARGGARRRALSRELEVRRRRMGRESRA